MPLLSNARIIAVIPARYASTRLPGKMVAPLAGKPLVLHAYERALRASLIEDAIIAADDKRIVDALAPFGAKVLMTRPDHPCGTNRIAEASEHCAAEIIVNVQGDEVMIAPETIDAVVRPLLADSELVMCTARHLIRDAADLDNPNVVKVVCDARGKALYFSRHAVPYVRDAEDRADAQHWQHIGIYAYRREFLLRYAVMPQTPLERLEKLEQLRVLENGYAIAVVDTGYAGIGVDTPEELERVRALLGE
jgi:3-deoxy-manno-octulosonate cytidylyltransferase (CMP-KDO synthetase)